MVETVALEDIKPSIEPEEKESEETSAPFEIKNIDDVQRILTIARGGDPNAIQALAKFMNLDSITERSNFPTVLVTLCIGQLNGFGSLLYPNEEWNPYTLVSEALSVGFMGYKGFKSNQFVDMTRDTPNLDALKSAPEEVKQGLIARFFGRGKSE